LVLFVAKKIVHPKNFCLGVRGANALKKRSNNYNLSYKKVNNRKFAKNNFLFLQTDVYLFNLIFLMEVNTSLTNACIKRTVVITRKVWKNNHER